MSLRRELIHAVILRDELRRVYYGAGEDLGSHVHLPTDHSIPNGPDNLDNPATTCTVCSAVKHGWKDPDFSALEETPSNRREELLARAKNEVRRGQCEVPRGPMVGRSLLKREVVSSIAAEAAKLYLMEAKYAEVTWRLFYREQEQAHPGIMSLAYAWDEPPRCSRLGERVFDVYTDTQKDPAEWLRRAGLYKLDLVGWVSLIAIPQDPSMVEMSYGIRPQYEGRGFRRKIMEAASDWAFEKEIEQVVICVSGKNLDQIKKCMCDSDQEGWFKFAGRVWYPAPGYRMFTRMRNGAD